eukprot:679631-Rhodomonas_salina.8
MSGSIVLRGAEHGFGGVGGAVRCGRVRGRARTACLPLPRCNPRVRPRPPVQGRPPLRATGIFRGCAGSWKRAMLGYGDESVGGDEECGGESVGVCGGWANESVWAMTRQVSALHWAALGGHLSTIIPLLRLGLDPASALDHKNGSSDAFRRVGVALRVRREPHRGGGAAAAGRRLPQHA